MTVWCRPSQAAPTPGIVMDRAPAPDSMLRLASRRADGRMIVADTYNDRIRAIDRDERPNAGGWRTGIRRRRPGQARFQTPCGVFADTAGNIHVADTGNGVLRRSSTPPDMSRRLPRGRLDSPVAVGLGRTERRYLSDERGRVLALATSGQPTRSLAQRQGFTTARAWRHGFAVQRPRTRRARPTIVADSGNTLSD